MTNLWTRSKIVPELEGTWPQLGLFDDDQVFHEQGDIGEMINDNQLWQNRPELRKYIGLSARSGQYEIIAVLAWSG